MHTGYIVLHVCVACQLDRESLLVSSQLSCAIHYSLSDQSLASNHLTCEIHSLVEGPKQRLWVMSCQEKYLALLVLHVHVHSSRICFYLLVPLAVHCILLHCTNTGSIMNYRVNTICTRHFQSTIDYINNSLHLAQKYSQAFVR